ncbi:hypothetical protein L3Q82_011258 [Scortum barcoo]|uniref:Uncharacterized protein n=1 Tax=Scortum barcoo TaxID=214431 RepID=A0ACB8W9A1_9TELE|nr:hypothetical protein L3Q82_011258 [Scortum barcoo]
MTTFDDILEEAGKFGRCQRRIFTLLCIVSMPFSGVYVGIVFQGFTPDHWCQDSAVVERRQACGWSLEHSRQLTLPPVNSSGVLQPSSCEQYEVDWNSTTPPLTCDTQELNLSKTPTTGCKNGWEYDYEGRQSFVTEFDLVCSDAWLVDMYQATLNVGFLVGSITIGYLADRFGRKMSFLMSNLLNGIAGILVAVAPNYVSLLVFRTLYGFGVKGGWMAGYVLITEIVGVEYRRTVGIIYQMFFSIGILILPLLAYFITDWRWLQVVITIPYILFLSYYWFVPESPRWLLSQNRKSDAVHITEEMAKENKMTLSKNIESLADDNAESTTASFMDLIRTPKMRKHTFILSYNWFTSAVVYQGLIMRLGILEGNVYVDFLISGLVEFPAAFLILFTIERIGRRLPFASANIVAGAACFITAFIPDSMIWFKTVVACIGRLGITMAFEMVVFVNTELYPTFVRNLGVSVCSTLCDVGGIVAPFLLYRLAVIWLELPLIIFGSLAFIAGGLVLLLPETRGVPLPDTIDDIEFPGRTWITVVMATFDDLLEEAGNFGRCQKRLFALLCLLSIPFTGMYVGIVFMGFTPDHWCRDSAVVERRQACGWSLEHSRWLNSAAGQQLRRAAAEDKDGWEYQYEGRKSFVTEDGWEYQYEGRKSFVTEFNLVCSDAWFVDMFQSTLNAGFLVGSFAFGYFADRFGRKISFLMSNVMSLIAGIALAVAPNYISILVFRVIFGFAAKGGWMATYVLLKSVQFPVLLSVTEIVGVEYRRTVGILYQMFFSVGILILPLLAYFITDWRWMQVVITVPYVLFMSYYWFIPESPRWLISQNNTAKAQEIMEALAKENKRKISKRVETLTGDEGDSPSASLLDLIRTPNMRKHTFILMFNWFTSAVIYQGLIMRVGIAGGNVYVDFFISGLVEFPAAFLTLFTIERIGRRLPFASANIVAGAACLITAFIPDSMFWFKMVVACIGRLGITMAFEMVVFVNTELYPTFVRNLGVSVCSTLCDVGGIVAPFLLYRLAVIWLELPLIIFGMVAFIAGGLVLLLPETRGAPLPETIDDIEFPNR